MSANSFLPLSVLAIGAGAAIGWLLRESPAAPVPPPAVTQAEVAPSPPAMLQAEVKPAVEPAQPPAKPAMCRFADGTELPLLNGVKERLELPWPPGRPWSPIAGTVRDDQGDDWYRHADGSWSTTLMRMDTVKGHVVPVGAVYTDGGPPVTTQNKDLGIAPPAK